MPIYVGENQDWAYQQEQLRQHAWDNLIQSIAANEQRKKEEGKNILAAIQATPGGYDSSLAATFAQSHADDPELMALFQAGKARQETQAHFFTRAEAAAQDFAQLGKRAQAASAMPNYGPFASMGDPGQGMLHSMTSQLVTGDPSGYQTAFQQTPASEVSPLLASLQAINFPTSRLVPAEPGLDMAGLAARGVPGIDPVQAALVKADVIPNPADIARDKAQEEARIAAEAQKRKDDSQQKRDEIPIDAERAAAIARATQDIPTRAAPEAPETPYKKKQRLDAVAKDKVDEITAVLAPDVSATPANKFDEKNAIDVAKGKVDLWKMQNLPFLKAASQKLAAIEDAGKDIPLDKLKAAVELGRQRKMSEREIQQNILKDLDSLLGTP